jgi:hypothetical protein
MLEGLEHAMTWLRWTLALAAPCLSLAATAANWVELGKAEDGGMLAFDMDSVIWHGNVARVEARSVYDPPRPEDGAKTVKVQMDLSCYKLSARQHAYHL